MAWSLQRHHRLSTAGLAVAVFLASTVLNSAAADPGFVGMEVQGLSPGVAAALGLKDAKGVLVRDVALGGPAAQAGVRRGDLIIKFGGQDIDTFERLVAIIRGTASGRNLPVTVLRQGKPVTLTLKTGPWPEAWKVQTGAAATIPELGLTLAALTPQVRERMGVRWGAVGVIVTIVDDTKVKGMSLKRGELIHQVNQHDVWLPEQMVTRIKEAKAEGRKEVLLLVEGVNGFRYVLLPVP
jgi:serine protease Do